MPVAPHAAACSPVACAFGFDVIGATVGGAATGAAAILVFLLSKHLLDRSAKRDSALMLLTEIDAIMSQTRPKIFGVSTTELYYTGAYDGLHKSGNIRHIPFELHRELARLYGQYENGGPDAVDLDAAAGISACLEAVVRNNRGYREKLGGLRGGLRRAGVR